MEFPYETEYSQMTIKYRVVNKRIPWWRRFIQWIGSLR